MRRPGLRLTREQRRAHARALGLRVVRGGGQSAPPPLPPVVRAERLARGFRVLACPFCGSAAHTHDLDGLRMPPCADVLPGAAIGYVIIPARVDLEAAERDPVPIRRSRA